MKTRERAEATAAQIIEMLKDAWDAYNARESDGMNVVDMLDAFAAEHVRALLADDDDDDYAAFRGQCPSCSFHSGHDPEEWFAAKARRRGWVYHKCA
jgi:hypothetical protein